MTKPKRDDHVARDALAPSSLRRPRPGPKGGRPRAAETPDLRDQAVEVLRLRVVAGLTVEEVCALRKISRAKLYRLESLARGLDDPRAEALRRIAREVAAFGT